MTLILLLTLFVRFVAVTLSTRCVVAVLVLDRKDPFRTAGGSLSEIRTLGVRVPVLGPAYWQWRWLGSRRLN